MSTQEQTARPDEALVYGVLLKATSQDEADWSIRGIASDESKDVEGDDILRKALDLTYAQSRGYINWHHSREPEHQLGYLTRCDLVEGADIQKLSKALGTDLSRGASVYFEGELYPHVDKAVAVRKILQSDRGTAPGYRGLGVSLDGAMARSGNSKTLIKAFVRGIAVTPMPVNTKTLVQLKKALLGQDPDEAAGLTHDQAVWWVMQHRPKWSYELAEKFVTYAKQ